MRILCLTSRLPYPPNRGDRLRAFHFIEHLSQDHDLTLVSFIADESQRAHLAPLQEYCQDIEVVLMRRSHSVVSVAYNLWRREPLQTLYYRSGRMHRLVEAILASQSFDAAYVHLFRMAPYVANHPELYRVIDLTDVISREISRSLRYRDPLSRLIYRIERPRIERYECWVARTFEETWLISEVDAEALAARCPAANVEIVTNGIDTGRFYPTGGPVDSSSVIFVGHMRIFHNVDAACHLAQKVLPLVRREVPGASLTIVGADPAPSVQRLGHASDVTVTGYVPDLNAALNRSEVFAAPLRFAAGVQNKILEAMAAARPVVTTSLVNEGLRAMPDQQILIADDPASTARQIVTLLQDEDLRRRIGRAGLAFVRQKYTWEQAVDRMRHIEAQLGTG